MKAYTVRITRQAREHLRGIKKHIAEELLAPEAANNTIRNAERFSPVIFLRLFCMTYLQAF